MLNTAFVLKFTTPGKLACKVNAVFTIFALLCTIFAPSKLVSIQFIVQCFFNNI